MAEPARRLARRRARRRRIAALCVGVAVLAGGAGTAWALTGSSGSAYRLASVERADVQQTVPADGTLSAQHSAVLSFAAGGTVSSVRVAVGDPVSAGELVATLDPTALNSAVTSAQQTLANAQLRLANDEDAQANGATTTSSLVTPAGGPSGIQLASARFALSASGSTAQQQIRAAQQAVVTAQHGLDAAVAAVGGDLDGLRAACTSGSTLNTVPVVADDNGTVSGPAGTSPEVAVLLTPESTSANPQTVGAGGSYTFTGLNAGGQYTLLLIPVGGADCSAALDTAARDGAELTTAKQALYAAIGKLDDALSTATSVGNGAGSGSGRTGGGTGRNTTPSKGTPTKGTPTKAASGAAASQGTGNSATSATGGRTGGSSGTGVPITAEQIAADAKSVDAAQAALAVAQHDIGYATLTSPISGVVGAVTMQAGSAVSASSSSAAITVVGSGTLSTQVDVSLDEIDLVKVGQTAQVTVDGLPAALAARVTYVGAVNASSSGSTASYPVTVSLDSTDSKLFDGMGASVAIDVGTARQALTVPLSAVHSTGRLVTVTVYTNGTPTLTRVTLGVIGADRAQVTSGLKLGQSVVLADLNEAVPSSSTTLTRRGTGLGGLTGGGAFGGVGGRFTRVGGR